MSRLRQAQTLPRPASPHATRLPPIWLSASALAAAITVVFGVQRWIDHFRADPAAQDLRLELVAARVGLRYGWSHIYDVDLQKTVAAGLGPSGSVIDSLHVFDLPPPAAWMLAPLAWQPPAVSFALWTAASLIAFVAAWWLIVPRPLFPKLAVLLVSLALWPVHYEFWQGQTVVATLALLAASYWLLERDRWLACGLALAVAFCFKPQDALLVPAALLVSGRWRPVAAFAGAGAVIVTAWVWSLGQQGIQSWINVLSIAAAEPSNAAMTYSSLVGRNAAATTIELALGIAALVLAWTQRRRLDIVFCLGLVGTLMAATHLHEHDITMLVLGAWIMLRARPSALQRIWLLVGIAAAQLISLGQPIPMLLWEPGWMVLLALEPRIAERLSPRVPSPEAAVA